MLLKPNCSRVICFRLKFKVIITKKYNFHFYVHIYKKEALFASTRYLLKKYIEVQIHFYQLHYLVMIFYIIYQFFLYLLMFFKWFFYLLYFCITISYNILLPIDNAQADAVDIGITIKPIPVRHSVIELDVVAKKSVSNDFNIVVIIIYSLYFFFDLWFSSLKYVIISCELLIWLLKLFLTFNFF